MLKPYRTIQDVLASPWVQQSLEVKGSQGQTDRVLRSTKLESNIYHDLRREDMAMDEIEQGACQKLSSFPALSMLQIPYFVSGVDDMSPRRSGKLLPQKSRQRSGRSRKKPPSELQSGIVRAS